MRPDKLLHAELTDDIIGGCYSVYRVFGHGFLVSVYKNELAVELSRRSLVVKREVPVGVGLLFNFGPEPKVSRMVYSNSRK